MKKIKLKSSSVDQYLEQLNQSNYWRLFVDGYRQKTTLLSPNFMGKFQEVDLGHLLWATREPNGLNRLKHAALELYGKDLNEPLTFGFIEKVHKLAYPFEDHLRLSTGYLTRGDRFFGHITENSECEWIQQRAEEVQKIVGSKIVPWVIANSPNNHNSYSVEL